MTQQAENLRELLYRQPESSIRNALKYVKASVREEIVNHYGGSLDVAVTHLHLGSR